VKAFPEIGSAVAPMKLLFCFRYDTYDANDTFFSTTLFLAALVALPFGLIIIQKNFF
jgi:hypothetical protein